MSVEVIRRRLWVWIAACLALALVVTYLVAVGRAQESDRRGNVAVISGLERIPSETITDWVSFADQASTFTVVGERSTGSVSLSEEMTGGYIGRVVTIEIDDTQWRRAGAPKASKLLEMVTEGWVVRGDGRVPASTGDGPRLEVGQRYFAPLVKFERGWGVMSNSTILSTTNTVPKASKESKMTAAVRALAGDPLTSIAAELSATEPYPEALENPELGPDERWAAVARAGGTE